MSLGQEQLECCLQSLSGDIWVAVQGCFAKVSQLEHALCRKVWGFSAMLQYSMLTAHVLDVNRKLKFLQMHTLKSLSPLMTFTYISPLLTLERDGKMTFDMACGDTVHTWC